MLKLKLTDQTSGNTFSSKRSVSVPDPSAQNILSEIKILFQENDLSAEIVVGDRDPVVEYNQDLKSRMQLILTDDQTQKIGFYFYSIDGEKKTEVLQTRYELFTGDSVYTLESILERNILKEGKYQIIYQIEAGDKQLKQEKEFEIIWYEKPVYLYDVELAIQPMYYILTDEELKQIEGFDKKQLTDWFNNYWQSKDPDPETPLNEIQLEFYNRVMKADRQYEEHSSEGWQSERGKALILYGDPDRVEKKRYMTEAKPYEIWYYEAIGRKLIFVDVNDDGSYRLMNVEDIGEKSNE
jgi:GWxTD domain-containing protein